MAERRMFSKAIIDSDAFLDMGLSTQALYFHLSMRADDDGFLNNPKKILRMIGAAQNEMELLLAKKFILSFESGVIVIKHWRVHNYIRNDRYKETNYKEEKNLLKLKENKSYQLTTVGIPVVDQLDTQVRLGKVRLGKDNKNINVLLDKRFNLFWNIYDKKVGKDKCYKYFIKLKTDDQKACLQNVQAYVNSKPDKQFRKDPYSFLYNRTWEDEIIVKTPIGKPAYDEGENESLSQHYIDKMHASANDKSDFDQELYDKMFVNGEQVYYADGTPRRKANAEQ